MRCVISHVYLWWGYQHGMQSWWQACLHSRGIRCMCQYVGCSTWVSYQISIKPWPTCGMGVTDPRSYTIFIPAWCSDGGGGFSSSLSGEYGKCICLDLSVKINKPQICFVLILHVCSAKTQRPPFWVPWLIMLNCLEWYTMRCAISHVYLWWGYQHGMQSWWQACLHSRGIWYISQHVGFSNRVLNCGGGGIANMVCSRSNPSMLTPAIECSTWYCHIHPESAEL